MKTTHHRVRRAISAIVLAVGGLALSAAIWASGSHGFALAVLAFYAVASMVAYRWAAGQGDVAAILGANGDERQRGLDRDATSIAGISMSIAALVGAIVSVARSGDAGAFGVICLVGGGTYAAALAILQRRR